MQALRVFKGHAGPVTAAAWRPGSELQVASAAHDGVLRLWDMRSAVPLATLGDCAGSKLFAAAWGWRADGGLAVATGGEDARLRVYDSPAAGEDTGGAVEE